MSGWHLRTTVLVLAQQLQPHYIHYTKVQQKDLQAKWNYCIFYNRCLHLTCQSCALVNLWNWMVRRVKRHLQKTLPKLHSLDHTLYRGFAHLQKLETGGSTVSLSDSRVSGLFGVSPDTLPARILYWRPCQPAVREPWTEKSACYGETALPFRCVEVCFI